ncbi:MAG: gliding motility protein GldM [Cytophagales bacterium]|nr:MAG: gliding motility protein GldM [Cytophagales bacterium]
MAGGKETPRQKMIGMMYLVLTALLALQVSSAIIQKFQFLDDSLMFVNGSAIEENTGIIKSLSKAVEKAGNNPKDIETLKKAEDVRKKTSELISFIQKTRDELISSTGGKDDDGVSYKGAKEEEKVVQYMVGPEGSKKGVGYKLQKDMNEYGEYLKTTAKIEVPKLALDGKEDPLAMKDPNQKRKDFPNLNFAETPMVAALAVLAQKESQILKYESEALAKISADLGNYKLDFDQIKVMVRPKSSVVAAGTKYEAEMFLAASSSAIVPSMKFEGRTIDVKAGMGIISFPATGGAYDKDGNVKKKWSGSITIKNKSGQDTTFTISEEYIVAKPVISVQSASVNALYKNCGNELNVQVPALGSTYSPSFAANGAQVINGAEKGKVTLVPTGTKVELRVSSGGNYIGSQEFGVRLIPKPTIKCLIAGKEANTKSGEVAASVRSIQMKADADESFKTFLPKDALFSVSAWDCILVRGKRPLSTKNFSGQIGQVPEFAGLAQAGDRILIEVKKVNRTNFLKQVEDVSMPTTIINIPLN